MKTLSPVHILLVLLLLGLAVAGWLYGLHWKRVASGDLFTQDEMMMIRLQDQIETLSTENQKLRELAGLTEEDGGASAEAKAAPPVPLPNAAPPELPRPQAIETH